MIKNKFIKYLLGIVGAILIGAFGSGIWELLLKPLFDTFIKFLFSNTSYIVQLFKNSIYKSAAKGFHEEMSNIALFYILMIILGIIIQAIADIFGLPKFFTKELDIVDKKIEALEKEESISNEKLNEIKQLLKKDSLKRKIGKRVFAFNAIVLLTIMSIQYITLTYKNDIITEFKQRLAIMKPYIEESEYYIFESRFSRIKEESDYLKIINDLSKIADINKITLTE